MPTEKPKIQTRAAMVTRLIVVRTQMAELKAEDRAISSILVKSGPGELFGASNEKVLSIYPSPKLIIEADKVPLLKEILREQFDKLIDQVKVWKPVKSCREIARAVLKPIPLEKFFAETEVESEPYIRIS